MVKRRPRKSMKQWRDMITDQQACGLSRVDYCLQHDIHIYTFNARLSDINRRHDRIGHQATDNVDVPQLVKVTRRVNATEKN